MKKIEIVIFGIAATAAGLYCTDASAHGGELAYLRYFVIAWLMLLPLSVVTWVVLSKYNRASKLVALVATIPIFLLLLLNVSPAYTDWVLLAAPVVIFALTYAVLLVVQKHLFRSRAQ